MSEPTYTLYCGDCLDYMRGMDAGSVDVVITDPPYPNNGDHFMEQIEAARIFLSNVKCTTLTFWSEIEIPPVPLPLVALHISTYNNVNGRDYEAIYHFHSDGVKRKGVIINHWMIKRGIGPADIEYCGHPTQKSIFVMRQLIIKHTRKGDTIFDPFMGSGTTGVACMQLGRNFIGCEIDPAYYAIAEKRIKDAAAQPALFTLDAPEQKYEQGVFI